MLVSVGTVNTVLLSINHCGIFKERICHKIRNVNKTVMVLKVTICTSNCLTRGGRFEQRKPYNFLTARYDSGLPQYVPLTY